MAEDSAPSGDLSGVEAALLRIAAAVESWNTELVNMNTNLTDMNTELAGIKATLQAHSRALDQIAQSNIGQWECCLHSGDKAEALLAVSLKSYDKTPPARYDEYAAATASKGV